MSVRSRDRPRHGELAEIRRELRLIRWYVDDQELRDAIDDWIESSLETTDADTAREYVEHQLNQLLARHPMYHAPRFDRGADAFPDECSDCRHYGSACPVLVDQVEVRWRERKLEQAETDEEARQIYQQAAIDTSCQRIPEYLETWDSEISGLVLEGERLLSVAHEELDGELDDVDDQEAPLEIAGTDALAGDGGGL